MYPGQIGGSYKPGTSGAPPQYQIPPQQQQQYQIQQQQYKPSAPMPQGFSQQYGQQQSMMYSQPGAPPPYQAYGGRKKSLLVGINYRGQRSELKGCINDIENMKYFISTNYGYSTDAESMLILREDATLPQLWPTKQNILAACQWLTAGAQPGDALFFHFSGHGGQTKDLNGDEDDRCGFSSVIMSHSSQSA